MSDNGHWLAKVEAVLRADTGDLRKLAEIGGEDARTLYIGTSMDGVDLSGQDLRGMKFTRLDPAKVRMDSNTQLDTAPVVEHAPALDLDDEITGADGMVLFTDYRMFTEFLRTAPRRALQVAVYGPDQERAFNEDAAGYGGPKFVVFEARRRAGLERYIHQLPPGIVILFARRAPGFEVMELDRDTAASVRVPIVVVQASIGETAAFRAATLGAMRDAISILSTNWDEIRDLFDRQPVSIFLRSRGQAPEPLADALAQLFERTHQLDLLLPGTCLISARSFGPDDWGSSLPQVFFPHLHPYVIDGRQGAVKVADAALLLDSTRPSVDDDAGSYEIGLQQLLTDRNGWGLQNPQSMGGGANDDAELVGMTRAFNLRVALHITQRELPQIYPSEYTREVDLEDISRLIVSPEANEMLVAAQLIERRELWVNMRDICAFRADDDSIWTLLHLQLRRLARVQAGPARTQYLSLFVRAALQRDRVRGDPDRIIEALNETFFSRYFSLSFSKIVAQTNGAIYQVKLHQAGAPVTSPPITSFRFHIDRNGPQIHSIVNPPETANWMTATSRLAI